MRFTKSELNLRRPVWLALSELYLDTHPAWHRVAAQCARSPFDLTELRRILFDEVHPVVGSNLRSVAGVWDGFDEDRLVAAIMARQRGPCFRLAWWEDRRYPWRELKPRIAALRRST